jgi:hypothetical protein
MLISGVNYFLTGRYFAFKTRNLRTLFKSSFSKLQHECFHFFDAGISY